MKANSEDTVDRKGDFSLFQKRKNIFRGIQMPERSAGNQPLKKRQLKFNLFIHRFPYAYQRENNLNVPVVKVPAERKRVRSVIAIPRKNHNLPRQIKAFHYLTCPPACVFNQKTLGN